MLGTGTIRQMVVGSSVLGNNHNFAAAVVTTCRTHAVAHHQLVAIRAGLQVGRSNLVVVCSPHITPRGRLTFLWYCHEVLNKEAGV